jgi:signal transduction histidine kinase
VATTAALTVALSAVALLIWLGAYAWLNHTARHILRSEMEGVMASVTTEDGRLAADRYAWNEPHHVFEGRHVDPFYLQLFDARGRLVRQSDNIRDFDEDTYPQRPLAATTWNDAAYDPLRTVQVNGTLLYYSTRPIVNATGEQIGTIQLARVEPQVGALQRLMAASLGGGLLLVLLALAGLVWWVAGRVLRPLNTITASARAIAPHQLRHRIAVPDEADQETAHLAATLNTLLAQLETAFDEMRRFTASAAHELKTPLTVLQGHVDVALRRPREAADYQETLRLVRRKIDHLVAMVGSLLTLARLDQSEAPPPDEPIDLARLVRAEAEAFREAAAADGLGLHVDAPAPAPVCGRAAMLREVVINLLDNALKYTSEGYVDVAVHSVNETTVLTIADTGVGMDGDERAQATDRFFRATSVSTTSIEGSGLGLSLVDQIVTWHGGALTIESAPGDGTTVTVRLPSAAAMQSENSCAGAHADDGDRR